MFKKILVIAAIFLAGSKTHAQNEVSLQSIRDWENISKYELSDDGNYLWYSMNSQTKGPKIILKDLQSWKEMVLPGAQQCKFLEGGKFLIYSDKVGVYVRNMLTSITAEFKGGKDLQVPLKTNNLFCYLIAGDLYVRRSNRQHGLVFKNASQFFFNSSGSQLVLLRDSILSFADLNNGLEEVIAVAKGINNINFDKAGEQIAFSCLLKDAGHLMVFDLLRHKMSVDLTNIESQPREYTQDKEVRKGLFPQDLRFSPDGNLLFFKCERNDLIKTDSNILTKGLDVWNYKDQFINPVQFYVDVNNRITFSVSIKNKDIIQLEDDSLKLYGRLGNRYVLRRKLVNEQESYWKQSELAEIKLLDLETDEETVFGQSFNQVQVSDNEKYVTWFDAFSGDLFCYDIKERSTRDLALNNEVHQNLNEGIRSSFKHAFQILCWLQRDEALIVKDKYDLWQLDPQKKRKPICLTSGYGLEKGKVFGIAEDEPNKVMSDSLLLSVTDPDTKYNGFSKIKLSKTNQIEINCWGPYYYSSPGSLGFFTGRKPTKALKASRYIVQRQSDTSMVNLFSTINFKTLVQITHLESPKNVISKCVPIQWLSPSGRQQSGLLYLPLDLDSSGKYPVIFNYYEVRSDERFLFRNPGLSATNINIPWYLSRGYLVFIPDVFPERGKTGLSALETITSAADYLPKAYNFIDKNRLGLQGHSHGGYLTNFVVTHSNMFAAAQSSAGYADFFMGYGQIGFGDLLLQNMQEIGQNNMGVPPWVSPEVYWENSALLTVDKVSTPLLIMHNKDDGAVNFIQGQTLFTALRRAGKKVWLLQYDGGGHGLAESSTHAIDFSTRQQQFFDYYLKGAAAPQWMIEGIPTKYKEFKSGLQLDSLNRTP